MRIDLSLSFIADGPYLHAIANDIVAFLAWAAFHLGPLVGILAAKGNAIRSALQQCRRLFQAFASASSPEDGGITKSLANVSVMTLFRVMMMI